MRVFPVQQRVLPGLIKGAKSLPKEVAAIGTAATAAFAVSNNHIAKPSTDGGGYDCGSVEAVCTPLLSF